MARSLSEAFGSFVAEHAHPSLPQGVLLGGRRALLNGFATALNAAGSPAVSGAVAALLAFGPRPEASLIGRGERLDPPGAAFVNAIGMNLLDFDDTHLPTVIHPTAPVAPVVLALAEASGLPGRGALAAFVLGAEVACRIGETVPTHYARGWHITSTCGTFGAAAASAKLLGLDTRRTAHALGIASSLASGTVENLTTGGKNASVGNAARNGILAALLARAGYEASPTAIEGKLGWARASGDEPDASRALEGLGRSWAFERNALKPYPAGIVFHSVIDACLELRARHAIEATAIERIVVRGDALLLARGMRPVLTHHDARVSLHHAATAVFLYGAAGIAEFEQPKVMAAEAATLRERVSGELDEGLPKGAATVEVKLRDGSRHRATVIHASGSLERPLSDAEVEEKLRRLAEGRLPAASMEALIAAVWRLDELPDLGELMRSATPPIDPA